jgi:hypothetical protein
MQSEKEEGDPSRQNARRIAFLFLLARRTSHRADAFKLPLRRRQSSAVSPRTTD